jgi:iron(III) transport system ATP-binding protein
VTDAHLRLEGLCKHFTGAPRPALDDLTLTVDAGAILVLLGTSGAGKTTLLRIIAGLDEADAGRVVLGEHVLSDPRIRVPPERRGVGLVFQHLELWPHMTVAENIAFGLPGSPPGRAAEGAGAVVEVAEAVGVEALLDRRPETLSGGERQRVAIARTLAPEPDVILYDEPLANLDPDRRAGLRRLIRRLCRERDTTLVYVTHDAEEAMEMGDDIAVLSGGRVVDQGSPDELYRRPTSLEGARALGPLSALPGNVSPDGTAIDTRLGVLEVAGRAPEGPGLALIRPEAVGVDGNVQALVVEARPSRGAWRFTARVDDLDVMGCAPARVEEGARVGLRAEGPVAVVPEEVAP